MPKNKPGGDGCESAAARWQGKEVSLNGSFSLRARKLDRYKHERVHGTVKQTEGEMTLDTSEMRTRLVCSGDLIDHH